MSLKIELKDNGSTSVAVSSGDGTPTNQIQTYKILFNLERVTSGSYVVQDLRLRCFMYHHFGLPTLTSLASYTGTQTSTLTFTPGAINFTFDALNHWMNDIKPPRIDDDRFSQEIVVNLVPVSPTDAIDGTNATASNGAFELCYTYSTIKNSRFDDIPNSYSYESSTSLVTNPTNWLVEERDNAKTKTISTMNESDNVVTIVTTAAHGYSTDDGITVSGLTDPTGAILNGIHKITVIDTTTFTYPVYKIPGTTITEQTSGTTEVWDVITSEGTVSSAQGDGAGLISVTTSDHGMKAGDLVDILGTSNYNGTGFVVSATGLTTTTFQYTDTGNTNTSNESGTCEYSGRAPSSAMGVNYTTTPKDTLDHNDFTFLLYPSRDSSIDSPTDVNYGSSGILPVTEYASASNKMVYTFALDTLADTGAPYQAELNAFLSPNGYGSVPTFDLFQMTNNTWPEDTGGQYSTVNGYIDTGDIIDTYNYDLDVLDSEEGVYTKFDISDTKIQNWLSGDELPAIAVKKQLDTIEESYSYFSKDAVTSPGNDFRPFLIIASDPAADSTAPTMELTSTTMYYDISTIQGDGAGTITINTTAAHGLSINDVVNVFETDSYNGVDLVVLTTPTTTSLTLTLTGNTDSGSEAFGVLHRPTIVDVSARGTDDIEISDSASDVSVRASASFTDVVESNIVKSPDTIVNYDFILDGLSDGYFDTSTKDVADNQSDLLIAPIAMSLAKSSVSYDVVSQGDTVDVTGFNIDNFTTDLSVVLGDSTYKGGVISGGTTQTIPSGSLDADNNQFAFTVPANLQAEYTVGTIVGNPTNTLEILNSSLKVDDLVTFNATDNEMVTGADVGEMFYVKTATPSGSDTVITLAKESGGTVVALTLTGTEDMVLYNMTVPLYVTRDGIDASSYSNILYLVVDDFGPKVDIPVIATESSTISVTISDVNGVDLSSIEMTNGTATGSNTDVNGDGRVIEYGVLITGPGTFSIDVADNNGNVTNATASIPATTTPFIEVVGYTITDADNFVLNMKVTDANIQAIEASDNDSAGVFVEGSTNNVTYGVVSNLVLGAGLITFDITVSNRLDGIMTVYAKDDSANKHNIKPPVLTSLSPTCFNEEGIITLTGINLNQDTTTRTMGGNMTIIDETTDMLSLQAIVDSGSEGTFNVILTETVDSNVMISNTLTGTKDDTAPIITLIGDSIVSVTLNGTYTELGATAIDIIAGDVSDDIITSGVVDVTTLGSYMITYTATDGCNNISTIQRQVNVITGCPIFIESNPIESYVGDIIVVTATEGLFNAVPSDNIVTFNGVFAQVLSGTTNRTTLRVLVPYGATTGSLQVETGRDNDGHETCSLSNVFAFTVLYADESFDEVTTTDSNGNTITKRDADRRKEIDDSRTTAIFGATTNKTANYNRDLSFSGYSEVTDENSTVQNVFAIILTRVGERLFNPEFGTRIYDLLHSIVDDELEFEDELLTEIIDAVGRYEERVTIVREESFISYSSDFNDVKVILALRVPSGTIQTVGLTLKSVRNS